MLSESEIIEDGELLPEFATKLKRGDLSAEQARMIRDIYAAKRAKIEHDELTGSLVRIEQVSKDWENLAITLREGLMNIPARLGAKLAGLTDVGKIEGMLENEIRESLKSISIK